VIGLLEAADAHHPRAVTELRARAIREDRLLLVASAYAEILVGPMRKGHADVVEGFVRDSRTEVVPIDAELARSAARLRARHRSLRLADALVLACAHHHEAELLTFDDRLRRIARERRA
jgi:predicted nucleic acid-binding protein